MAINLKEGNYLGETLNTYENIFFKLSITSHEKNSLAQKHYHENNYLSILINGNYIEKTQKSESFIISGDILYRPNCHVHQNLFNNTTGSCFNIEFKKSWNIFFDKNYKLPDKYIQHKGIGQSSLYKLLINYKQNYNEDLAFEFIFDWLSETNNVKVRNASQPWVSKIVKILENDLETFHSLNSLSEQVFVHPAYLSRAFKAKTGLTVSEYQLKMKLSNALSQLLNTSLTISDISFRNGFYDDAHFIRSFKSLYGVAPYKFKLIAKS